MSHYLGLNNKHQWVDFVIVSLVYLGKCLDADQDLHTMLMWKYSHGHTYMIRGNY
jgi:hypothetical protein